MWWAVVAIRRTVLQPPGRRKRNGGLAGPRLAGAIAARRASEALAARLDIGDSGRQTAA